MKAVNIKISVLSCVFALLSLMGMPIQAEEYAVETHQLGPLVQQSVAGPHITSQHRTLTKEWLGPVINEVTQRDALQSLHTNLEIAPPFLKVTKSQYDALYPEQLSALHEAKLPKIAILIDDLGYNRHGMESALALPHNVALAILPMTPFAKQTAVRAKEQTRVTMLHAPMENVRELKLGPGGLYVKMSEKELKKALIEDIDSLPGIKGVNNHMGSLLTAKQDSMDWVMETLQGRSLFFIDSLTSSHSVAHKTAQKHGLKTTSRDVFLDNIRSENAIDRQFTRLIKKAKRNGQALAIGHPYPETMTYLKKRLVSLQKEGVRLVPLTSVLQNNPVHQQ